MLSSSATENQLSIGTVTATDDDGDTLSFSLSGNDASAMNINPSSGVLVFSSAPDYETKVSYSAIVTVSDGINSVTQSILVNITDANDMSPVFTSGAAFSVVENQTGIGTITATDDDGDTLSFSLSGTDASSMSINSSSGVLVFNSAPDYETKTSYSATVTASDGTNSTTQDITITITDIDDTAPVFTSSASFSAAENQTSIGTVTATDVDTDNASITFSISGSELAITSGGVLTFASTPDYETKSSYSATVTASDGTNSSSQSITVNIVDVDDVAPVFTSSAGFSAAENQTSIGTVTATDVDTDNASITFSISGSELSITSSGVLTFVNAPDYETKSSYSAIVTASDGANSTSQSISVTIIDQNDVPPVFTSNSSFSVAENQTSIGTVTATDEDTDNASITFSISGSEIAITSSGVLTFVSAPDYETKTSYSATVTASDGVNSMTQNIIVTVTDVDDVAPTFTSSASFSAAENQTSIGIVTATDEDTNDSSITFGISGTELSITSSGILTFVNAPDYETKSSYSATVTASDGTNMSTQVIVITVINVNERPSITSGSSYTVNENQKDIGFIVVQDDSSDLIFELSGTDSASISINNVTGELKFKDFPDYENKNTYSAIARVYDEEYFAQKAFQIFITNLNDNTPVITSSASFSAAENQTGIGTITATDDDGDTLSFSLSGTDASSMSINSSSGVLVFNSAPDYETKTSYSATVTASDGTNSTTQDITITITDIDDTAPVFTSSASFSAAENQTSIGTVTATDVDTDNASITFSISGSELAITSGGVLTFASTPDYETKVIILSDSNRE